jgi:hypothetical protein
MAAGARRLGDDCRRHLRRRSTAPRSLLPTCGRQRRSLPQTSLADSVSGLRRRRRTRIASPCSGSR